MARTVDELTIRRAVLLLRCQRAREAQQRRAFLAAERTHGEATGEARAADDALRAQVADAGNARAFAYERLRGQIVDVRTMMALASFEDRLTADTAACQARQREAAALYEVTGSAVAGTQAALGVQTRVTAKRARLA